MVVRLRSLALLLCLMMPSASAHAADLALDYRQTILKNGMRVVTLEDFGCPIVAVQVWYHVGSKNESPERQGFAHMFEHMMFRGTDRLGPTDHFDLIRRTGGSSNAYTSFDETVYVNQLPANQLELVLWLEAERMGFLRIDQKNFDTERKVVEEERRKGLNQPYGSAPEQALAQLYSRHPYRWLPIGKIPHLRATPVQELRDFWARYYVPNNATLVIVGAVKHDEAQRLARQYFEWMPREAESPPIKIEEPQPTRARAATIRDQNAPAPGVAIGWRTVPARHDDAVPLQLLATILGGGESSRLYREIVAERQLGVMAAAGAFYFEQDGVFGAGAMMTPFSGNQEKILTAMRKQIETLRTEKVRAAELSKAKNQMLAGVVTSSLTIASKATLLGTAAVVEGDVARVNRRLERIRAVTADDLLRVAQTYLPPERSLSLQVEQNLLGAVLGRFGKSNVEEDGPITAKPETKAPTSAKPGLRRPASFPEKPPSAVLPDPKFARAHQSRVLANGLKVHVVARHQVPFVNISLGLRNGACTEQKPGTVGLAMSMLTRGTRQHTEKQLAEELESHAISLAGSGSWDAATVNAGCLSEHTERALNLLAEVVLSPTFAPKEFDKLRMQVITGLALSQAEPGAIANRVLNRQLYGEHPYGRTVSGTVTDVAALKADILQTWWKSHARPDQAVLIFAGDITPERAFALAEKAFGGWKAEGPPPEQVLPKFPKPEPTRIYLVDFPGSQNQIRIGQRSIKRDHAGYPVARVVSGYFGQDFGSRLNQAVRVQQGLTYGARAGYAAYRFSGEFSLSSYSKTETAPQALKVMLAELDRLTREGPSAKELDDTKSYLLGRVVGRRETPSAIAAELWQIELENLPLDFYEKLLAAINKTSADACLNLVRETIDPKHLAIVVVGPADKLKKELEAIAPVTVLAPDGSPK